MKTQNKTIYVWLILILTVIGVLTMASEIVSMIRGYGVSDNSGKTFSLVLIGVSLLDIIVSVIYIIKLNAFKYDVLKWTNIFGIVGVVHLLVTAFVFGAVNADYQSALLNALGGLVITIIIWVAFYRHLKKELSITSPVEVTK